MGTSLKCFSLLLLLFSGLAKTATAGQQIYLSESPNAKYRIIIEQVIDRRVGDKVFFRYPLILVNARNPQRHFEILEAGSPLVQETEKQTFKIHWNGIDSKDPTSIRFNWAPDSLRLFIGLEVIEGSWKTYFVDVNTGKTKDITADLEETLVGKIDSKKWDCEEPRVQFVKWVKPHLAFIKLISVCGKQRKKSNEKLFYFKDSALFDTLKGKVVNHCLDCEDEKAAAQFGGYYLKTLPTPTPRPTATATPEETPTAQ
jgi:hypothetical protein